ncbi:MAG: YggT family protein [Chloroflexi bacterium]|nr:YggT family protein [Chloroflexota bacterium]
MDFIYKFIYLFTWLLSIAIFVRAILSWFRLPPENPLVVILYQITEPILAPLRRVIHPLGGMIDITPIVAILILQAVSWTVQGLG